MFIGNDAANKMRAGAVQGVHQSSQLFLNEDMDTVSLQEPYMFPPRRPLGVHVRLHLGFTTCGGTPCVGCWLDGSLFDKGRLHCINYIGTLYVC